MEIAVGYKVNKPVESQEECANYCEMATAVNNHNRDISDGEHFWEISEIDDYYEVIESDAYNISDVLESKKTEKISESKVELKQYLEMHPLQWIDGEYYSVTEEKQSLLTSNLAAYQISVAAGNPIDLTWNATGARCKVWTYENLVALSLDIVRYVKPFVSKQQDIEIQIKNCKTQNEIDAIKIEY